MRACCWWSIFVHELKWLFARFSFVCFRDGMQRVARDAVMSLKPVYRVIGGVRALRGKRLVGVEPSLAQRLGFQKFVDNLNYNIQSCR